MTELASVMVSRYNSDKVINTIFSRLSVLCTLVRSRYDPLAHYLIESRDDMQKTLQAFFLYCPC